jgi:hypothetical protein
MALTYAEQYPKNFHLVRFEDIIADNNTLPNICTKMGLVGSETLQHPSWNGARLDQVYPWGTIRIPTPDANIATMNELTAEEKADIRISSLVMLRQFGYENL